jgi:MSV199 domain
MKRKKCDVVDLIKKNPIMKLSHDYQNTLVNKIKERFTDGEQQLFVGSFYCYLNYDSKKEFVVDLDNVWKWIGFSRKGHAKSALEKHFVEDVDYKVLLPRSRKQNFKTKKGSGGSNEEQIMMTVHTFKKFCLKAGTKKADDIHEYFIKLEELLQETINEETDELRNQLLEKNDEIEKNKMKHKMDKHKLLIEKMKTKKCVYIGEIEENKFIKIGSSKSVNERNWSLNNLFGNMVFLEIFECDNYREAEEDILKDPEVKKYLYKKKINGHTSKEVVQLTDDFNYDQLITIVKKYVNKMYMLTPEQLLEKQKLDLEKQKLEYAMIMNLSNNDAYKDNINKFIQENLSDTFKNIEKNIMEQNNNDDDTEDDEINLNEIQNPYYNTTFNTKISKSSLKGRKIQQIDPNNLTKLIKVYPSIGHVLRDPNNNGFQPKSLSDALNNNRIYKDYRWYYVKSEENPDVCGDIPPTKKTKHPTSPVDSILELNSTKTEITDSFSTRILLAEKLGIGHNKIGKIIANNEKYNDNYYIELCKCPQELIEKYDKPINRHVFKNSKQIKQIHPITKQIVIFKSLADLYRRFGLTGRAILKAIDEKVIYQGYLWEYYNP